jgi:hypothetical protein
MVGGERRERGRVIQFLSVVGKWHLSATSVDALYNILHTSSTAAHFSFLLHVEKAPLILMSKGGRTWSILWKSKTWSETKAKLRARCIIDHDVLTSLAWSVKDRRNVNTRILRLLVFSNSIRKLRASHTAMTMLDWRAKRNKTHIGLVYFLKPIFCPCHSLFRVDLSVSSAIISSDQKLTNDINSILFLSILFLRLWVNNHISTLLNLRVKRWYDVITIIISIIV